jgi:DNA-binding response OmpR family regulator
MKNKILLVEDDLILGETICDLLEAEAYDTTWVKDGNEALDITFLTKFDIFLLDINIPFINGFEFLKSLRESGDLTPAIFITANIDLNSLKKGFDVGADDYIKKPFDFDELLIRIESLIKKTFQTYQHTLEYKNLSYNIKQKQLFNGKKLIHLSPNQLKLVEYFLQNLDKALTKDELLDIIAQNDYASIEVLRVYITNLKKIGFNIINIRGIGYRCEKV